MRKLWVAGTAVVLVFAVAAIAIAQEVTNTYEVTGSTTPRAKGTKKKPIAIGIKFGYSVSTTDGRRPTPVEKYSIRFGGTQVNKAVAPTCSKTKIEQPGGPDNCPAGSIVGRGFIENATGDRNNPNDQSIVCNASLTVVNAATNDAFIYVEGNPNSTDPRTRCAIELAAPIPAEFIRRGDGVALEFEVPDTLLHPLPTLSNAVKKVTSTVSRKVKRIRGKKRGYFEAIGGCRNGTRTITVVFTPETGNQATAQARAKCS